MEGKWSLPKLCPLEIQWITYGSINILTTEGYLFFFSLQNKRNIRIAAINYV